MRKAAMAGLLIAVPRIAWACPVCFGQNDSPMATATNLGIMAMLGVVVAMLASFATFFVYLSRRARLVTQPEFGPSRSSAHIVTGTEPQEGTAQC